MQTSLVSIFQITAELNEIKVLVLCVVFNMHALNCRLLPDGRVHFNIPLCNNIRHLSESEIFKCSINKS